MNGVNLDTTNTQDIAQAGASDVRTDNNNGINTDQTAAQPTSEEQTQAEKTKHEMEEEEYNSIPVENEIRPKDAKNIEVTVEDDPTPPELSDDGEDATSL